MSDESFRATVLLQLQQWADQNPTEMVMSGITRSEVYSHILRRTPIGQQLMTAWYELAAEHVLKTSLCADPDPGA